MRRLSRQSAIYWALLAASFAVAVTVSWISFGAQIDNDAYDWMFRLYQPPAWQPESILLAIDEPSLNAYGGMPGMRKPLAEALRADRGGLAQGRGGGRDPDRQDRSRQSTRAWPRPWAPRATWCWRANCCPIGRRGRIRCRVFAAHAAALGHVHVEQPDQLDSVGPSLAAREDYGPRAALGAVARSLPREPGQRADS